MLAVMFDVGDKVNQELSTYGANIVVRPRNAAVLSQLYDLGAEATGPGLAEDQVANIKTIFWAFNIVEFAPFLETDVTVNGVSSDVPVTLVGTWYAHHLSLPTGEHSEAGVIGLRQWWQLSGGWISDQDDTLALLGSTLANRLGVALGDTITVTPANGQPQLSLQIAGIMSTGGAEDEQLFTTLATAQQAANRPGEVDRVEVSALTTPDNDLARRAARNPRALSVTDWETWYCTAYASAIAYQITEVIDDAVAKPVRQITESQGMILEKTQLIMVLVTALALLAAALGIANLVSASVLERSAELGLLKAVGASNGAVVALVLAELLVVGVSGGVLGFAVGMGAAQFVGQMVFDSYVTFRPVVAGLTALLVVMVVLLGSLPAIRQLLRLEPAEVLHGR
jgi:putative ABC transport system permease protein